MARCLCLLALLSVGLVAPACAKQQAPAEVVAWGCRGIRDSEQCSVPAGLSGVTGIAAGEDQSLALESPNGVIAAWGCGGKGTGPCRLPIGNSQYTAIAAGADHGLALGSGTVATWGCEDQSKGYVGQCTPPNNLYAYAPRAIAAGGAHSLALKGDGTVAAWGCGATSDHGQCDVPAGLSGVTAIAAGSYHSLALRNDGTAVAWGCRATSDYGQCSVPSDLDHVTAIAAGAYHSLAMTSDGTVVAWGCGGTGDYGQCNVPVGLSGVTAISAGDYHSLALRSDGTVVAWGCRGTGDYGQCAVAPDLSRVIAIAAGRFHSLALVQLKHPQWIDFAVPTKKTYGDRDFTVSATASSGLPVTLATEPDSEVCALRGLTVHITGLGECSLVASQSGDATFGAAAEVWRSIWIAPAPQSIAFPPIADKTFGAAAFPVYPWASSGLPVDLAAFGSCIVSNGMIVLVDIGPCTVTASQSGNYRFYLRAPTGDFKYYARAPVVARTFTVKQGRYRVPTDVESISPWRT